MVLTVGSAARRRRPGRMARPGDRQAAVVDAPVRRHACRARQVVRRCRRGADSTIVGYALHLPLAGSDTDRLDEIEGWLDRLDPSIRCGSATCRHRPTGAAGAPSGPPVPAPGRHALWHGDKSFLQLSGRRPRGPRIRAGDRAGYRLTEVPGDGHLVLVGAGSAHGVASLADGASPFHFARTPTGAARAAAHAHLDVVGTDRHAVPVGRRSGRRAASIDHHDGRRSRVGVSTLDHATG